MWQIWQLKKRQSSGTAPITGCLASNDDKYCIFSASFFHFRTTMMFLFRVCSDRLTGAHPSRHHILRPAHSGSYRTWPRPVDGAQWSYIGRGWGCFSFMSYQFQQAVVRTTFQCWRERSWTTNPKKTLVSQYLNRNWDQLDFMTSCYRVWKIM